MKIQALVAAVALALAGTAFAAETTTTTTTTQPAAQPDNSAASHMRSAKHKVKAKAQHLRHRMHEQHARETTTTTTHHHMASRHMSTNHMGSVARARRGREFARSQPPYGRRLRELAEVAQLISCRRCCHAGLDSRALERTCSMT